MSWMKKKKILCHNFCFHGNPKCLSKLHSSLWTWWGCVLKVWLLDWVYLVFAFISPWRCGCCFINRSEDQACFMISSRWQMLKLNKVEAKFLYVVTWNILNIYSNRSIATVRALCISETMYCRKKISSVYYILHCLIPTTCKIKRFFK